MNTVELNQSTRGDEIDFTVIVDRVNSLALALKYLNVNRLIAPTLVQLEPVYNVGFAFAKSRFAPFLWLQRQRVHTEELLQSLKGDFKTGLYNSVDELLTLIDSALLSCTKGHMEFEKLVNRAPYELTHVERPGRILGKLVERRYSLQEAIGAFRRYLNVLELRDKTSAAAKKLRTELDVLEFFQEFL